MPSHKTFWALVIVVVFCALLPFIILEIWNAETLASTPHGPAATQSAPAAK